MKTLLSLGVALWLSSFSVAKELDVSSAPSLLEIATKEGHKLFFKYSKPPAKLSAEDSRLPAMDRQSFGTFSEKFKSNLKKMQSCAGND